MRLLTRAGITAGVCAAVVGLAGCGSSSGSLLTTGAATQLTADLNQASKALSDYNCAVAATALSSYRNDVSQLQGVNTTLTSMLSQGASTISTLAEQRCPTGNAVTTATDSTTTSSTTTTATDSTTTATISPVTTTDTGVGSGGATPTTDTTPTTPGETVTTTAPVTTPDSGGAGLGGTVTDGTGGTGVGAGQ